MTSAPTTMSPTVTYQSFTGNIRSLDVRLSCRTVVVVRLSLNVRLGKAILSGGRRSRVAANALSTAKNLPLGNNWWTSDFCPSGHTCYAGRTPAARPEPRPPESDILG